MTKSITSRAFDQDVSGAKRAADKEPVVITDRGLAADVLMTLAEYSRVLCKGKSLVEMLAMPGSEDIEFDPPKMDSRLRIPDFD